MRIITDTNAIFNIEINPFKKTILVTWIVLGEQFKHNESYIYNYENLDEWFSYSFGGIKYDFHFLYDEKFNFSIYLVDDNNEANYKNPIAYNLNVIIGI